MEPLNHNQPLLMDSSRGSSANIVAIYTYNLAPFENLLLWDSCPGAFQLYIIIQKSNGLSRTIHFDGLQPHQAKTLWLECLLAPENSSHGCNEIGWKKGQSFVNYKMQWMILSSVSVQVFISPSFLGGTNASKAGSASTCRRPPMGLDFRRTCPATVLGQWLCWHPRRISIMARLVLRWWVYHDLPSKWPCWPCYMEVSNNGATTPVISS